MSYLDELNAAQREAVISVRGPLLVVAGAGAGKTRTLVYRMLHLIKNGTPPEDILAVTFTNKAANEMRERVSALLGGSGLSSLPFGVGGQPFIGTFHSLGAFILRRHGRAAGVHRNFTIKDKDDSRALVREAIRELGLDRDRFDAKRIAGIISKNKGECATPDEFDERIDRAATGSGFFLKEVLRVWHLYEQKLRKEHALDFDDLLLKPVLLLASDRSILERYQETWRYIHIDEYQDTNRAQYRLSRLLARGHGNICVVGDADQTIYTWRGANMGNILRFEKDYPKAKAVFLEENYRSTKTILAAAANVIEKNRFRIPKRLFTANADGEKIELFTASDGRSEAEHIAAEAEALAGAGARFDDIAVLYRANFQSRALEEAFLSRGIPYVVLGTRFFERKEVKDVLAFIRAALNRDTSTSSSAGNLRDIKRVINVPPRGVGKVTIAKVFSGQMHALASSAREKVAGFYSLLERIGEEAGKRPPHELVAFILKASGLEEHLEADGDEGAERLENIKELATLASRYARTMPLAGAGEQLEKFLEDAALASDQDALMRGESDKKGVRLMTAHAAKGLEFPYVFVVGLEQGLFPLERDNEAKPLEIQNMHFEGSPDSPADAGESSEEERRLFYVALTRAQKKIFLSYAAVRTIFGSPQINTPSEFIADIPEELIEYSTSDSTDERTALGTDEPETIYF